MSWSMKCVKFTVKICQNDIWLIEYFKFRSEITDIGLRINFKESGVDYSMESKVFAIGGPIVLVMFGQKVGEKK